MQQGNKYGLQLRVPKPPQKQKLPQRPPIPPPLGFRDEDDDDNVEMQISRHAVKSRSLKEVELLHQKALEQDPSVFDYDAVYDDMKQKEVLPKLHDRQKRESKYIGVLMEKAKERERQHEIVFERKLAKERTKEEDLYKDKDKFVTGAYKRKLAELAKWEEEERRRQLREEQDDVTKKSDISDFYLYLQKNVAFGGKDAKTRKLEKQQEAEAESAAGAGASEEAPPSTRQPVEPAMLKMAQSGEASTSMKEPEPAADMKPTPDAPDQGEAATGQQAADQPKREHHKRSEDAVAAAKERYLARQRMKEQ
uniref:Nuclear speckle splicing regulatory protein 1 N-terminal domain-containing protein n=1 Tax=Kalanchoe fedtschenkoi TaxID=63787 RepID=A0A7N0U743_KALFE